MRHPYAINLKERQTIPLVIAVGAFGVALLLGELWKALGWTPPAWVDVPSTIGLYGLGYQWFRRRLWKVSWLRALGASRTPMLEGKWTGTVTTSFDEFAAKHQVSVEIFQDWTEISVILNSETSRSHSVIASLAVEDETAIGYEYCNEPTPHATSTMHAHRGMAGLVLSADGAVLKGHYYSGRDRRNCGQIEVRRTTN